MQLNTCSTFLKIVFLKEMDFAAIISLFLNVSSVFYSLFKPIYSVLIFYFLPQIEQLFSKVKSQHFLNKR